jgi:hypothetical protein
MKKLCGGEKSEEVEEKVLSLRSEEASQGKEDDVTRAKTRTWRNVWRREKERAGSRRKSAQSEVQAASLYLRICLFVNRRCVLEAELR